MIYFRNFPIELSILSTHSPDAYILKENTDSTMSLCFLISQSHHISMIKDLAKLRMIESVSRHLPTITATRMDDALTVGSVLNDVAVVTMKFIIRPPLSRASKNLPAQA